MNNFSQKWITYQKERFPLPIYSLLILTLALASGAVVESYAFTLQAFVMALGIFMLLRIADEFKDYADDCQFRPYRAVPRGLISLKELGVLGALIIMLELFLGYMTQTLSLLLLIGLYWGLMSREFFVPTWLKNHPIVYLLSHMIIMPLIALLLMYVQNPSAPEINLHFLALAFFNGVVLEVGRKIRQKSEEEKGVETYSFLWGIKKVLIIWLIILTLSLYFISSLVTPLFFGLLLGLGLYLAFLAYKFSKDETMRGKKIETFSGVWLLLTYLLIFISDMVK